MATIPARPDDHEAEPQSAQWPSRGDLAGLPVPWPEEDPQGWLVELAKAADTMGFAGIALMDHLIQIPQVDRAWEPIPSPWVTLGLLTGLDTQLSSARWSRR